MDTERTGKGWSVYRSRDENILLLQILGQAASEARRQLGKKFDAAAEKLDTYQNPAEIDQRVMFHLRLAVYDAAQSPTHPLQKAAHYLLDQLPDAQEIIY